MWLLWRATSQQEKDSEEELSTPYRGMRGLTAGTQPPECTPERKVIALLRALIGGGWEEYRSGDTSDDLTKRH